MILKKKNIIVTMQRLRSYKSSRRELFPIAVDLLVVFVIVIKIND